MVREILMYCPFCGFETLIEYEIMLHIETLHSEDRISPFVVQEDSSISALQSNDLNSKSSSKCHTNRPENLPYPTQEPYHSDLQQENKYTTQYMSQIHTKPEATGGLVSSAITILTNDVDEEQDEIVFKPRSMRNRRSNHDTSPKTHLKTPEAPPKTELSSQSHIRCLGKSELGPYAHEAKMPIWLARLLKEDDGAIKKIKKVQNGKLKEFEICPNMMDGIIPVLANLLFDDRSTEYAYLCHPSVKHTSRLKREGGFCGYRNIQMMTSYIISTESQGHDILGKKIPSIFDIQDYIEMAWDIGINSHGRIETNGILGSRKYIGTSEAQAMFCGLGIACDIKGITTCKNINKPAFEFLFTTTENYFIHGTTDFELRIRHTQLPPIYLQHKGHSMTIIGFEKKYDGSKNLIVFDPRYSDSSRIIELIGRTSTKNVRSKNLLGPYRKGISYLRKYEEFEILMQVSINSSL